VEEKKARYDAKGRRLFRIYCNVCGEITWKRAGMRFCSRSCAVTRQHEEQPMPTPKGAEHYAWLGADAGYKAVHARLHRTRGSADHCENGCVSSRRYEWAHIHGTDPGDPQNYRPLCKPCHQKYDLQTGSDHANSRLTVEQVAEIRARYAAGGISQTKLAAEYGCGQGTVSNIVLGKRYRME
jgi:transposase-like protein